MVQVRLMLLLLLLKNGRLVVFVRGMMIEEDFAHCAGFYLLILLFLLLINFGVVGRQYVLGISLWFSLWNF